MKSKIDSYVVIDLETTGLNPKRDSIIEIGAIKVADGIPVESYHTMINPGRILCEKVQQITGITQQELAAAPYIEEILPEFLTFAGDFCLVGHSVIFDYSFLKRATVNQNMDFEKMAVDTLQIAKKFLPQLKSKSLSALCRHYEIPHHAHRALQDAEATFQLFERLKETFYREDENAFCPRKLVYQVKKETPLTMHQKERLIKLLQYHKLTSEFEIDRLTRSEASRYTDMIIARHGRIHSKSV